MERPIVLCVDDEPIILAGLQAELKAGLGDGYDIELARSAGEGLEILDELIELGREVPVIISDQVMMGMQGDKFLVEVAQIDGCISNIMLSGYANEDSLANAKQYGNLFCFIPKPWDRDYLLQKVMQGIERYHNCKRAR